MFQDIPFYVLHCKALPERKLPMVDQLEKANIRFAVFFEEADPYDLALPTVLNGYAPKCLNLPLFEKKMKVYPRFSAKDMPPFMKPSQISLAFKHGLAYRDALVKFPAAEFFVFLEDDVKFGDDLLRRMNFYMTQTPDDWDVIYFGNGCELAPANPSEGKLAYQVDHPASRCSDSILVRRSALSALAENWFPFSLPSDWELSWLHLFLDHRVYWWFPALTSQGSQNRSYTRSISE